MRKEKAELISAMHPQITCFKQSPEGKDKNKQVVSFILTKIPASTRATGWLFAAALASPWLLYDGYIEAF